VVGAASGAPVATGGAVDATVVAGATVEVGSPPVADAHAAATIATPATPSLQVTFTTGTVEGGRSKRLGTTDDVGNEHPEVSKPSGVKQRFGVGDLGSHRQSTDRVRGPGELQLAHA